MDFDEEGLGVTHPDLVPYFAQVFTPVVHFHWDSNILLLFARWQH